MLYYITDHLKINLMSPPTPYKAVNILMSNQTRKNSMPKILHITPATIYLYLYIKKCIQMEVLGL